MKSSPSSPRPALEILARPEGGAGGTRPLVVPPADPAQARLQVVASLHQLIDTLTDLSGTSMVSPSPVAANLPMLLDAHEAGRLMSVSRSKVLDLAARGAIPSIKIGRSVRIPRERLQVWMAERTNQRDEVGRGRLPRWARSDRDLER